MRSLIQRWRDNRTSRRENRLMEEIFESEFGQPNMRKLRKWPRDYLLRQLADNRLDRAERLAAESELKRQEAWDAPAGRAFYIAIAALIVSIISLIVALGRA